MHTQPNLRRHHMAGTCLLALPAALSLAHPAAAQVLINVSQNAPLNLTADGAQPVSIASGVNISATGWAAVSDAVTAHLSNAGRVTDNNGDGIYLGAGGALSNGGSISGADAVRLNAAGAVANGGVIQGSNYGVLVNNGAGQVSNTDAIAAGYDGVSLNLGGSVSNTGSIFGGHIGVYTGNALGSVSNSGVISARGGDAVSLYGGGSLTNTASGQLLGGYAGAYAGGNGSQITNAGLISGASFGAYLMGASSISNSGTIAGGVDGVKDFGAGGELTNTGLVHGGQVGVKLAANGAVDDFGIISGGTIGVQLGRNGTLAIEAGGRVTGGLSGVVATAGDVLRNAGSISGLNGIIANGAVTILDTGLIAAGAGGDAISLSGGVSNITLGTGAVISGSIAGGGTASRISLTGDGTLDAPVSGFAAGSLLNVSQNASWVGEGHWQIAQLSNAGIFTPGIMGTPLSLTGNFVQTSAGTLRVLVTPTGISPFAVNGTATLAGSLNYVLAPGSYAPGSDIFLTATGGITGSFTQVISTQPAIQTPILAVGGQMFFASQMIVAPSGASLFANTSQVAALAAGAGGQALLDHANGAGPGGCAGLPAGVQGHAGNIAEALAGGICAAGGWMQVTGSMSNQSGAYSARGGGFIAGLDRPDVFGGRIGVAVGYDAANIRAKLAGTAGLHTIRLGLYAAQPLGMFSLSGDVMDGIAGTNTTRETGAAAAAAKGSANVLSGDVQLAMPFALGGAYFLPAFGLGVTSVTMGRLDEVSATQAFAVKAAGARGTSLAPYLRLAVRKSYLTAGNLVITPDLSLGITDNIGNPGARLRLSTQDGTIFNSSAAHLAPVSGQFGAGLSVGRGGWSLNLRYSGAAAGSFLAQNVQAGVQVSF